MPLRNQRITVYAKSGRISIKTIKKIVDEHISKNNWYHADKALNEYIEAVEHIYKQQLQDIARLTEKIHKLKEKDKNVLTI